MILDANSDKYIKSLLQRFPKDIKSEFCNNVIEPPDNKTFLPRICVWCPVTQFDCELKCLKHGTCLSKSTWTDDVTKTSPKNPRLIYDLHQNIVLIQRIYICEHDNSSHRILSGDKDLLEQLPLNIQKKFQFKKCHKTMFSRKLIDFIFDQVVRGTNFAQITESIASLHYMEFKYKSQYEIEVIPTFSENLLYSFPGNDKIMNVFLDEYKRSESFYINSMNSLPLGCHISTDHTFKVGKHIGFHRKSDNTFVNYFKNLFIVMNEFKQIVAWKFCKSAAHEEIKDLLSALSERSGVEDVNLVMVDNCCQEKAFYGSFFPNAEVKLDLFHAIQRFVKSMPKSLSMNRKRLISKFTLIFRQNTDNGKQRSMPTPSKDEILNKLQVYLKSSSNLIDNLKPSVRKKLNQSVTNLCQHISKGCLSDIPVGCGTEANEGLHKLLNRSMIRGATTISPELAQAILAVLFHYHNEKTFSSRHICNIKTFVHSGRFQFAPPQALDEKKCEGKSDVVVPIPNEEIKNKVQMIKNYIFVLKSVEKDINMRDFSIIDMSLKLNIMENFQPLDLAVHSSSLMAWLNIVGFEKASELVDILDTETLSKLFTSYINIQGKIHNFPRDLDLDLNLVIHRNKYFDLLADKLSEIIVKVEHLDDLYVTLHIPAVENLGNKIPIVIAYDIGKRCLLMLRKKAGSITESNKCTCGKNTENDCCIKDFKSKCRCVKVSMECTNSCRCKVQHCQNREKPQESNKEILGAKVCHCGKKDDVKDSLKNCCNLEGKMKTRCPCFKAHIACNINCCCFNCGNDYGQKRCIPRGENSEVKHRKPRKDMSYKRLNAEESLKISQEVEVNTCQGKWNLEEKVSLFFCLLEISDCHDYANILEDYNSLVDHVEFAEKKSLESIRSKLNHIIS